MVECQTSSNGLESVMQRTPHKGKCDLHDYGDYRGINFLLLMRLMYINFLIYRMVEFSERRKGADSEVSGRI